MELFVVMVFYTVILAVCFWLGERLRRRRFEERREEPVKRQEPPPPPPEDEAVPHQGDPLDPEVLPDPRQAAAQLSRELEELAGQIAGRLGVEFTSFSSTGVPRGPAGRSDGPVEFTDLEEITEEGR